MQCKLIVPAGSEQLYADSEKWGLFLEIEEDASPVRGDVNGDGIVSVADVTALIEFIIGGEEYDPVADIDGDEQITVTDITAIVNLMLN